MKKGTIIWLVVASIFFLVGVSVFMGTMIMCDFDFSKLSTEKYETNEHMITDNFASIIIDTDCSDITFVPSEDQNCRIVCYERLKEKHTVEMQEETLSVRMVDTREWYDYISIFSMRSPKITVYLPKKQYDLLTIKDSTGDVVISKDFEFKNIDISVSTGDVKNYASASESIEIKVSTGDVYLTDVRCDNLRTAGDTGDVTLQNIIAKGKISIQRTTGDVKLDKCDGSEISIKTDTGDVRGSLLTDKIFLAETDTGEVKVPKTTTGGKCEIETDTGDIKIRIESN